MKKLLSILTFAFIIGGGALTQTSCGTLDKSGVYAGDKTLYGTDVVISSSYELIHSFVLFAYQNSENLPPEVNAAANRIRAQAPQWFSTALALRDAYKLNPTSENNSRMQQALDVLRAAVAESAKYLVAHQLPTT